MSKPTENEDQEKGDEVLRRLLKTPPDPKTGKGESKGRKPRDSKKDQAASERR